MPERRRLGWVSWGKELVGNREHLQLISIVVARAPRLAMHNAECIMAWWRV